MTWGAVCVWRVAETTWGSKKNCELGENVKKYKKKRKEMVKKRERS